MRLRENHRALWLSTISIVSYFIQSTLQIMLEHTTLQMTKRYVSSLGAEDMINTHKLASPVDNFKLK